jgi:hypothetical protein
LKHVERLQKQINEEKLHLVGCNLELYYDARKYEYQVFYLCRNAAMLSHCGIELHLVLTYP